MTQNIWERFNNIASPAEVTEAKAKFEPIAAGKYLAVLEQLAPAENKDGLPVLKGRFRTIEGNKVIFYNQNLQNLNYPEMTAGNIAEATAFIDAITNDEIAFTNLGDLANRVLALNSLDASGAVTCLNDEYLNKEYMVTVTYNKKNFAKVVVNQVVDEIQPPTEDTPM